MPKEKRKINTKKILPIVLCARLALLIVFGIVIGTVAIVNEARAVVSYNGIRIDRGVANYLVAGFKAQYSGDADKLAESAEEYVRRIAVAAYLFDRVTKLTKDEKAWIEENAREVLEYKAEGNKSTFNESAKAMGFDYLDFISASELIYKASHALSAIYGANGSHLSYSDNAAIAEKYFTENYSHAKILFVRTQDKLVYDTEGNLVLNEDGSLKTYPMDEEEMAAVAADVAEISQYIENANAGKGVEMTLDLFNSYYQKYNEEPDYAEGGYYFSDTSAFSAYFAGEGGYPNLVNKVLSMNVGEWGSSTDGSITCFIYKYAPISPDYAASDMSRFFSDFYSDAAEQLFMESVDSLMGDVKVKDGYREISVADIPKNNEFIIYELGIGIKWYK